MPKSRELKKFLNPLLKRRPDLAYDRALLFFQPLTHYARGVKFISSNYGPALTCETFAVQLFDGQDQLDWGGSTGHHVHFISGPWTTDDDGALPSLCDHIEGRALPDVEAIVSPREHEKRPPYMPGQPHSGAPVRALNLAAGACFDGDFDRAERVTGAFLPLHSDYTPEADPEKLKLDSDYFARIAYLDWMLRNDRKRIFPTMHEWEAHKVNTLKLTKYWTATPFPGEET